MDLVDVVDLTVMLWVWVAKPVMALARCITLHLGEPVLLCEVAKDRPK